MSDVLFDSGKFTLRPLAREKLAKISGIVLAYPTLKLAVGDLCHPVVALSACPSWTLVKGAY
jgi:hypothetical protein